MQLTARLESGQPRTHPRIERKLSRERGKDGKIEPVRTQLPACGDGLRRTRGGAHTATRELEHDVGRRQYLSIRRLQLQPARAQLPAPCITRRAQPALQALHFELGQVCAQARAQTGHGKIGSQRQPALAVGIEPGTQGATAVERQRIVDPRPPGAELTGLEFQINAAAGASERGQIVSRARERGPVERA